jgi:hypothetical protein
MVVLLQQGVDAPVIVVGVMLPRHANAGIVVHQVREGHDPYPSIRDVDGTEGLGGPQVHGTHGPVPKALGSYHFAPGAVVVREAQPERDVAAPVV